MSTDLGPLTEPVAWLRAPYGTLEPNPLFRVNGPQSLEWAVACYTEDQLRAYAAAEVARERERMIADGWRQTRYAAPVTECEACLTPDACAIRGQCGHYLRERDQT